MVWSSPPAVHVRKPSSLVSHAPSSVVSRSPSRSGRISEPASAHRMTRRNFIALVSLCMLAALGVLVVGVGVMATHSEYGQDGLRQWVQGRVASSINGK